MTSQGIASNEEKIAIVGIADASASAPLVSILIPAWNRVSLIEETLASATAQTYKNLEIIVVDNASTDGTWELLVEIARNDPRIRIFQHPTNVGPVRNWLRCANEARGQYAKILWSDDLLAPTCIETMVAALHGKDDVGFVFCHTHLINEHSEVTGDLFELPAAGVFPALEYIRRIITFDWKLPVSPGCALLRTSDLRKNLLIDVPNALGSDYSMHAIGPDLLILLLTAAAYPNLAYLQKPLASFRSHQGSISITESNIRLECFYRIAANFFVCHQGLHLLSKQDIWNFNNEIGKILYQRREEMATMRAHSLKDFYAVEADYQKIMGLIEAESLNDWDANPTGEPIAPPPPPEPIVIPRAGFRQLFTHPKRFLRSWLGLSKKH